MDNADGEIINEIWACDSDEDAFEFADGTDGVGSADMDVGIAVVCRGPEKRALLMHPPGGIAVDCLGPEHGHCL